MITLSTLKDATLQDVFDQCAKHLLTQGERSENLEGCAYRGAGDTKCAVGCFISDEEYDPELMEGLTVCGLLRETGYDVPKETVQLLISLQILHDAVDPSKWPSALESLAKKAGVECHPLIPVCKYSPDTSTNQEETQ